jgi:hypothetical protein
MSKPYPADILDKLRVAMSAWKSIDPSLKIGNLSLGDMQTTLEQGESLKRQMDNLEIQLTDLRNQRDEVFGTGWELITRLRSGVKAIYGNDSSEYDIAGGTRLSERKPRSRRVKAQSD